MYVPNQGARPIGSGTDSNLLFGETRVNPRLQVVAEQSAEKLICAEKVRQ
jgi:hypothetical protein